jgi:hypothetical protein
MLATVTGVIPLDHTKLLDAETARDAGYRHLAAWLRDAEEKWARHSNKRSDGQPTMTLLERVDHMRNLSSQADQNGMRVFYTASGTRLSAVRAFRNDAFVEHKAYWAPVRSADEAGYLVALINSAAALAKIVDLQSHGQRDKRDFDNLVWTLPIPEYDDTDPLHRDLAAAATHAETVAAGVELTDAQHFTAKRRAIRAALATDGVAAEMETMVDALLPP